MSPTDWNNCPNCKKMNDKIKEENWKKLEDQYGKVSHKGYQELLRINKEFNDNIDLDLDGESLREDYGFNLHGDTLHIEYFCKCQECGFSYHYKMKEKIL